MLKNQLREFNHVRQSHGLATAVGKTVKHTWWQVTQLPKRYRGWQITRGGNLATLDGLTFLVDGPGLDSLFKGGFGDNTYEASERKLIREHLPRELPVVELGACIGVVSNIANSLLADRSKHVVVEANPRLIPVLESNRQRNSSQFKIVNKAVAYGTPTITFHVHNHGLASSDSAIGTGGEAVTVDTTTLEALSRENGFDRISLVCDIEGSEIQLFKTEADYLRHHVACIIVEMHPKSVGQATVDAAEKDLLGLGFQRVAFDGDVFVYRK